MADHKKKNSIEGHGFRNLLFFLLFYIVVSPFLAPYPSLTVLVHASLSVALFVAVYAVQKKQKQRSYAIALLLPLLILYWLGIYDIVPFTRLGSYIFFAVYFGLLVYSYAMQIARSRRVTMNVLYGSFCLYLVIGLFWGSLYMLLNELSPGAYSGTLLDKEPGNSFHAFSYFSMVTLTSLGYGDITPQTTGAASLCQFEALIGQFFSAVLVAWLVGLLMLEKQDEREMSGKES